MSETSNGNELNTGRPTQREAAAVWLRIGYLGFGGPAGQIALMHRVLVDEQKWIDEDDFLAGLNFCMLLPGPEAQQLATYVGWRLNGIAGGLIAGTLFILPGALVILALSAIYTAYSNVGPVAGALYGVQAAVIAIVAEALLRISRRALRSRAAFWVAGAAFTAVFVFSVPFPAIIASAAVIGFLSARNGLNWFVGPGGVHASASTSPSAGNQISVWRGFLASSVCLGLWLAPVLLLRIVLGPDHLFSQQGAFFSQMAVVTFGGAYAVLTYVAQQAVDGWGWLTPTEMVDGLGLAETTPGPLVLVLQFVGYVTAAKSATGLPPLVAGLIGSAIVLWTTFLPCFAWIFAGGPFIEKLQRIRALSAALVAITASVVGVVLNLCLWFAIHVLFEKVDTFETGPIHMLSPVFTSIDLKALVLCTASMFGLFRFGIGLLRVLGLAAVAGMIISLVG